jgi:hypothetical protein
MKTTTERSTIINDDNRYDIVPYKKPKEVLKCERKETVKRILDVLPKFVEIKISEKGTLICIKLK